MPNQEKFIQNLVQPFSSFEYLMGLGITDIWHGQKLCLVIPSSKVAFVCCNDYNYENLWQFISYGSFVASHRKSNYSISIRWALSLGVSSGSTWACRLRPWCRRRWAGFLRKRFWLWGTLKLKGQGEEDEGVWSNKMLEQCRFMDVNFTRPLIMEWIPQLSSFINMRECKIILYLHSLSIFFHIYN